MLSNGIHIGRRGGVRLTGGGEEGWPAALRSSLVAFWKLDEASGNRADSVGSNTLTDNNTVTSAAGLVYDNAANFVAANSESLSVSSNATLQMGDVDFWIAAWVNATTLSTDTSIAGKWGGIGEYLLGYLPAGNFAFICRNAGNTATAIASVSLTETTNTWYFLCGWHSTIDDKIYFGVDNGTVAEAALTSGTFVGTNAFFIGTNGAGGGYYNGRIGPVMLGKGYAPTAADLTWLYNNGAGRAY